MLVIEHLVDIHKYNFVFTAYMNLSASNLQIKYKTIFYVVD